MKKIPSEKVCKAPDCSNVYLQYKSTQKVCSVQCAIALAKEKAYQKQLTAARIAKRDWHEKNITVQKLVGKVQKDYFNPWIRRRDKGKKCISCNVILEGKYDAGHYYPSTHFSLRFDEANVHGQCTRCNQWLHGNLIEYRKGLIKRVGLDEVLRLDSMAHQTRKWTREELNDLMERYPKQKK